MDEILNHVRTGQEADKLIEEIEMLLSSFYEEKGFGFENALRSKVRSWVSNILSEVFSKSEVDKIEFLQDLKKKLEKSKTLIISVAFEPTDEIIDKISDFSRKNFDRSCLIEIHHVPELLAGAQIVYEGNYFDFSIRKIFEEEFERKKTEIMEKFIFDKYY